MTIDDVIDYCNEQVAACRETAEMAEARAEEHHHRSLDYQRAKCDARVASERLADFRKVQRMLMLAKK